MHQCVNVIWELTLSNLAERGRHEKLNANPHDLDSRPTNLVSPPYHYNCQSFFVIITVIF